MFDMHTAYLDLLHQPCPHSTVISTDVSVSTALALVLAQIASGAQLAELKDDISETQESVADGRRDTEELQGEIATLAARLGTVDKDLKSNVDGRERAHTVASLPHAGANPDSPCTFYDCESKADKYRLMLEQVLDSRHYTCCHLSNNLCRF